MLKSMRFPVNTRWHTLPSRRDPAFESRETKFLKGTPLALIPAVLILPAWFFLVITPRVSHPHLIAAFLFPLFGIMAVVGSAKLARCLRWHELDIVAALSFGILLALFVVVVYSATFLFVYYRRLLI
jgi:hypothetical protein